MINKSNLYKEYTYEGQSYYESDSFDSPLREYLMDKCKYIVRDYANNLNFYFIIYQGEEYLDIDSKALDTMVIKNLDIMSGSFQFTFYNFRHEEIFNQSIAFDDLSSMSDIQFDIDQETSKELFNIGTYYITANIVNEEGLIQETVFKDRLLYIR